MSKPPQASARYVIGRKNSQPMLLMSASAFAHKIQRQRLAISKPKTNFASTLARNCLVLSVLSTSCMLSSTVFSAQLKCQGRYILCQRF